MKSNLPVGSPLVVCDAGRQGAGRKVLSSALLLCLGAPFGALGVGGLLTAESAAGWALVVVMGLSFLACVWSAVLTLSFGHLNRVELYADRIRVYDARLRPYQFHFSAVREIGWNAFDRCAYVILNGRVLSRVIDAKHFAGDEAARAFVAHANEALRDYQRRRLV